MIDRYLEYYLKKLEASKENFKKSDKEEIEWDQLEEIIKEVLELASFYSLKDAKNMLFTESKILQEVKRLFLLQKIAPGVTLSYGTGNAAEQISCGFAYEFEKRGNRPGEAQFKRIQDDSIFDLFTVSRVFTYLLILKLKENHQLNLKEKVSSYRTLPDHLSDVTIEDLLLGRIFLKPRKDLSCAVDAKEVEELLLTLQESNEQNAIVNFYLLKQIIEKVTHLPFSSYLHQEFPFLRDTDIKNLEKNRLVSTNFGVSYFADGMVRCATEYPFGKTNDLLAHHLSREENVVTGNSGIFSTHDDIRLLAQKIFRGKLLNDFYNDSYLAFHEDYKNSYFHPFGEYKNPYFFDPNPLSSSSSMLLKDKRGSILSIDPNLQTYFFLTANPTHHRVLYYDPTYEEEVKIYPNKKETLMIPGLGEMVISCHFLEDTKELVKQVQKLLFQYVILEDCKKEEASHIGSKVKKITL